MDIPNMEHLRKKQLEIIENGLKRNNWSWRQLAKETNNQEWEKIYANLNDFKRAKSYNLHDPLWTSILRVLGDIQEIAPKIKINYIINGSIDVHTTKEDQGEIYCPPEFDAKYLEAIRITSNILKPRYLKGQVIIYTTEKNAIIAREAGKWSNPEHVITLEDGRSIIGIPKLGTNPDKYNIELYYPSAEEFENIGIVSSYKIVDIKPS